MAAALAAPLPPLPPPAGGDAYAAMAARVRDSVDTHLRAVGYALPGHAGAARGTFMPVCATPNGVAPVGFDSVWGRLDPVMEVTVLDILLTNIMAQVGEPTVPPYPLPFPTCRCSHHVFLF